MTKKKGERKGAKGDRPSPEALLVSNSKTPRADESSFLRRYVLRSLEVFMYWMPVWVPLILLAQFGTRGLKPALHEKKRLLGQEEMLNERLEKDTKEAQQLADTLEALYDPIFIERLRRERQARQIEEVKLRGLAPVLPSDDEQVGR
ncbi:MAG: hypothetical protein ACI8X5_001520 [Planctomycetota bacterium]|jgi:hypothetical protein